jgi:hypothetical protein
MTIPSEHSSSPATACPALWGGAGSIDFGKRQSTDGGSRGDNLLQKIRNKVKLGCMSKSAVQRAENLDRRSRGCHTREIGRAKKFFQLFPCKPLIRLVSDERIQGNPNKSNS